MITIIEIKNLHTIRFAAKQFIQQIRKFKGNVFCFNGEMGAGKTTFITEICKQLGTEDQVNSPTFSIVNEYSIPENKKIYHFDFYRLNSVQEALDIGVNDYFDSNELCFVEWAENIAPIIPSDAIMVDIEEVHDEIRMVTLYERDK